MGGFAEFAKPSTVQADSNQNFAEFAALKLACRRKAFKFRVIREARSIDIPACVPRRAQPLRAA